MPVLVEDKVVQFDVFLEVSASHVVNVAKVKIACHVNCNLLVYADGTETNRLAFVLKLLKIDLQVFCCYFISEDLDGQLVDSFEIGLHS